MKLTPDHILRGLEKLSQQSGANLSLLEKLKGEFQLAGPEFAAMIDERQGRFLERNWSRLNDPAYKKLGQEIAAKQNEISDRIIEKVAKDKKMAPEDVAKVVMAAGEAGRPRNIIDQALGFFMGEDGKPKWGGIIGSIIGLISAFTITQGGDYGPLGLLLFPLQAAMGAFAGNWIAGLINTRNGGDSQARAPGTVIAQGEEKQRGPANTVNHSPPGPHHGLPHLHASHKALKNANRNHTIGHS